MPKKLDGTARGGILVALAEKHKLPVHFIGVGEGIDEIRIPSERAFRSRERALCEGLNIDRLVFDALVALRARPG